MRRAVFDSTVLISAFLRPGGLSDELLTLAAQGCRGLLRIGELVRDLPLIAGVVRDPGDDMILACALKGQADSIVTRDKDLLSLDGYQGAAIITPEDFRQQLRAST